MTLDYKNILIAHKQRPIEVIFEHAIELGYQFFEVNGVLYSVECAAFWKEVSPPRLLDRKRIRDRSMKKSRTTKQASKP